jgi:2-octaprenylphenol hydroxylase
VNFDCDVVIVGGGMVGATFAALLAGATDRLRIAVVEPRPPPPFDADAGTGLRVSALSAASTRVLGAGGVWRAIAGHRISPFREMRVWDAASDPRGPEAIHFDAAELGEAALGHIVENDLTQWVLWQRLEELSDVRLLSPARIAGLELGARRAVVELDDGSRLRAALVVGADGGMSRSRALAGIGTQGREYGQRAVVTHIATEHPHCETAWQRFLPDGPLALLPLSDGRVSIVWSTTPAHAERLLALAAPAFDEAVTEASGGVLGQVSDCGPRAAFPLTLRYADRYTCMRFALVGDAAHTIHPLAGQGVNLGLLDAAALAEVTLDALAAGQDPGEGRSLRRYERWRKGENLAAGTGIDVIAQLFRQRNPAVRGARRLGLRLVNRAPLVKNELVKRAIGLTGDLPRCARPGHEPAA